MFSRLQGDEYALNYYWPMESHGISNAILRAASGSSPLEAGGWSSSGGSGQRGEGRR